MVKYPWGKGPIMGRCPKCGHDVMMIYGDRIFKVGHCTGCGIDSKGVLPKEVGDHALVRKIIDEAYLEVSKHRMHIPTREFFQVVNILCVRRLQGHCPTLSVKELEEWGYDITGDTIYHRR